MNHLARRTGHMGDARQPNVCAGERVGEGVHRARLGEEVIQEVCALRREVRSKGKIG